MYMKRFLSLFVVFTLIFAPIVHASGLCQDIDYTHTKQFSKASKQGNEKPFNMECHCFSHYIAYLNSPEAPSYPMLTYQELTFSAQTNLTSITIAPLLEPPSHA